MKFSVVFTSGMTGWAIHMEPKEIGTNGVSQIRSMVGVALPIESICGVTREFRDEPEIEIPFHIAIKVHEFKTNNKIRVQVPDCYLNRFTVPIVDTIQDPNTGAIRLATLSYKTDKDAILAWWIDVGFPITVQ